MDWEGKGTLSTLTDKQEQHTLTYIFMYTRMSNKLLGY